MSDLKFSAVTEDYQMFFSMKGFLYTIYCKEFEDAINKYNPEVVIVNVCGAMLSNGLHLIMNKEDFKKAADFAQNAIIIASHMDTVSRLSVTRDDLRKLIESENIKNALIPYDGETIKIN